MEVTNLRILTRKSYMKFGRFADIRVGEVIDNFRKKGYLRWVYFNCSNISFCDDLLDELDIAEPWRIEKPGKNPDMYDNVLDCISPVNISINYRKHMQRSKTKRIAAVDYKVKSYINHTTSKAYLQRLNQGK